jgi:hypothetical protein
MRQIIELACRAPSVHNTQPWLWRVDGGRIDLLADMSRQLPVTDALGRSLTVSCGAALHHARVAAAGLGLESRVTRLPDPHATGHLASIEVVSSRRTSQASAELRALERRCTDRRRFTAWPVSYERLSALTDATPAPDIHITPIVEIRDRFRLELLASRAIDLQRADTRVTAEQHRWVNHSPVDGIPVTSLNASTHVSVRSSRFSDRNGDDHLDELLQGPDGILVISTDHDESDAWLRAGEALSAMWLRATSDGLSVVPLSQVIEVEETRLSLQHQLLGGLVHPQILVRIGWQQIGRSELPRTPRRPLDDVLVT